MSFPWNLILCLLLIYLLIVLSMYAGKWVSRLIDRKTSFTVLAVVLVLLLIQGFASTDRLPHTPIYTGALLCFAAVLVLKVIENIRHFSLKRLPQALSHGAIALVLLAAIFGRGDKLILTAAVPEGETVGMATDEEGVPHALPFHLMLKDFSMETYPSGMPKKYLSEVVITDASGKERPFDITVNHPATVGSWKIYQADYDTEDPQWGTVSILECVRDPWYPAVLIGLWMLLIAGAGMIVFAGSKKKEVQP